MLKSTVGAGDALLAGFLGSYNKGRDLALACGTAWAEATISNNETRLGVTVQESTIRRILETGRIQSLVESESSRI